MVIELACEVPRLHVVAFPFPAAGHLAPFLQVAKCLASYGVTVTFISATMYLSSTRQALVDDGGFEFSQNINLVYFDLYEGTPELSKLPTELTEARNAASASLRMKQVFEDIIRSLIDSPTASSVGPPLCIIYDMFLGWTQEVATKYHIPRYCLFSSPAHFLSMFYHIRIFSAEGRIPVTLEESDYVIPGFPPIKAADMVPNLHASRPPSHYQFFTDNSESLWEAEGVLVNSIYEMESAVIEGLQEVLGSVLKTTKVPKILTVGPTLLYGIKEDTFSNRSQANQEADVCLEWLDTQPNSSVLYIAFGSQATLTAPQIIELALGLEASGQKFLWVLRVPQASQEDSGTQISAFLPEGFMDRTKNQGLVFSSWAPQLHILAHPAVAGFLSHCGWNSTMESICMAVPMIAWPMAGEQPMNKVLLVDIVKTAVGVQKGSDGVVEKTEVERVVRLLMEDERGQIVRKNAKELSIKMRNALVPTGSSRKNLQSFVEELGRR